MFSKTDGGLPYGENNPEGGYYQKILSFREPRGGLTGIEYDLIRIQDPVKRAYNDLIINW